MAVRVIGDSTAYIPQELRESLDIECVSLFVEEGATYVPEVDIDFEAFYARLADETSIPKSAQPSPGDIEEKFRNILSAGSDVLGVFISSKMSGTFETALGVARSLAPLFPGQRIEIVDSESNSMQEGFALLAGARLAKAGATIDECITACHETMKRTRYVFAPKSLSYLARGGRIGKASALLGGMLKLVPILSVDEGEATTFAKVRTYRKALISMRDQMLRDAETGKGIARVVVHSIAQTGDAVAFCKELIEPIVNVPVEVIPLGPVIGAHVGPAVGLVYETNQPLR